MPTAAHTARWRAELVRDLIQRVERRAHAVQRLDVAGLAVITAGSVGSARDTQRYSAECRNSEIL